MTYAATLARITPTPATYGLMARIEPMSIGGTMPDRMGSAKVLSTNRNFAATRPASASSAPASAGERRLQHERQLGEPAGGADQPHDAGLHPSAERGHLDRVGDQQQRRQRLQQRQRDRRVPHAVEQREDPVQQFRLALHLIDAVVPLGYCWARIVYCSGSFSWTRYVAGRSSAVACEISCGCP